MAPEETSSRMRIMWGRYRVHIASIRNTSREAASSLRSAAWAASRVKDFSTRACLPASSTCRVCSACRPCGEAT